MNPAIVATSKPRIAKGFRLQWEAAQNSHVLLYPEGVVKLNGSAAEILKRCNGERTVVEIVHDIEVAFGAAGLSADVMTFVSTAVANKWVVVR